MGRRASLGARVVKNLLAHAGDLASIHGSKRSLKKDIETHSSILAWRIPWTEEPGELQSRGSQRVGHNRVTHTFTFTFCARSSVLDVNHSFVQGIQILNFSFPIIKVNIHKAFKLN